MALYGVHFLQLVGPHLTVLILLQFCIFQWLLQIVQKSYLSYMQQSHMSRYNTDLLHDYTVIKKNTITKTISTNKISLLAHKFYKRQKE